MFRRKSRLLLVLWVRESASRAPASRAAHWPDALRFVNPSATSTTPSSRNCTRGTAMKLDTLAAELYDQILQIPLIDPHTHIDPLRPASRTVDDILGYHYYTELAHS